MSLKHKLFVLLISPIVVLCALHILELSRVTSGFEEHLAAHKEQATWVVAHNLGAAVNALSQTAINLAHPKEIAFAVKMADNAVLFDWSRSFTTSGVTVLFTDTQGMVLARAPEEFRFGDVVSDATWFERTLQDGSFAGLAVIDGVKSLVSARIVRRYDDIPLGVVCATVPVTPNWLSGFIDDRQILRMRVGETSIASTEVPADTQFEPLHVAVSGFADPDAFSLAFRPDAQVQQLVAFKGNIVISGTITALLTILILGILLTYQLRPYTAIDDNLRAYSRYAVSLDQLRDRLSQLALKRTSELHSVVDALIRMIDTIKSNFDRIGDYTSRLETQANTDSLTGINNRRSISDVLESVKTRAEKDGRFLSVLMLDIDWFKAINDTYGHQTGDAVLMAVASILRRNSRKADAVGRWGGEEFLIVSPDLDVAAALKLAERLRAAVQAGDYPPVPRVTVSLGVAQMQPGDSVDVLIGRADAALYQAKAQGRNTVSRL